MKCSKCGKYRGILVRQNPTGEPGIFLCTVCTGEEPEPKPKGQRMTPERQLELWVRGESVHNDERAECCPDFSCCEPQNAWPIAKRIKFAEAFVNEDYETTHNMLMSALVDMVDDDNVYIAGIQGGVQDDE
jgi:hypothetical protein